MRSLKPVLLPPPRRFKNLLDNIEEIRRLLEIHSQLTGRGPGRKHFVEVLNKSAIVLLVATWEKFIEDLAEDSFNVLLKNSKNSDYISPTVKACVARNIKKEENDLEMWKLSGDNWKDVLRNYKENLFKKYIWSLNSPKAENIDALFRNLMGI